jgi:hypothetical protein
MVVVSPSVLGPLLIGPPAAAEKGSRRSGRQRGDLVVGRETAERVARQPQRAVDDDVELPARPVLQDDVGDPLGRELVPRTEGLSLVASAVAVLDADLHGIVSRSCGRVILR